MFFDGSATVAEGYELVKNLEGSKYLVTATGFDGGSGTESDPYRIANGPQFLYFVNMVNGPVTNGSQGNNCSGLYFILTDNINLHGNSIMPIGYWNAAFSGTFDGNGYTISGLTVDHMSGWGMGIFGTISGGCVKNVVFEKAQIILNRSVSSTG